MQHLTWGYPVYVGWPEASPKARGKEILVQDLPEDFTDSTLGDCTEMFLPCHRTADLCSPTPPLLVLTPALGCIALQPGSEPGIPPLVRTGICRSEITAVQQVMVL